MRLPHDRAIHRCWQTYPIGSTLSLADMESVACNESVGEKGGARLDQRCRIKVHSRTKRLADADGRSVKALLDGLAEGGVFADDSPECVQEVSQSQEITTDDEETVVDIWWE